MLPNTGTPTHLQQSRLGLLSTSRSEGQEARGAQDVDGSRPLQHHLSSVARRVLAQPICASAAERNWSVYGAIKTTARSRLGHAVSDKLVYCHEALTRRSTCATSCRKHVASSLLRSGTPIPTLTRRMKIKV